MAKQVIDLGTSADDNTGTDARVAGDMINDNFTELYSSFMSVSDGVRLATGDGGQLVGSLSNGSITASSISTGTGYPTGSGQVITFNGSTLDRCMSLYIVLGGTGFHLQGYNSSGVGQGWKEITTT